MAVAVATPTVTFVATDQDTITLYGTLAIGPSPLTYATKGIVMSFAGIDLLKSSGLPLEVRVYSMAAAGSGAANLWAYNYNVGTTQATGQLQLFTGAAAQTALTELSAGAIPAGVSGDTIRFVAVFPKV